MDEKYEEVKRNSLAEMEKDLCAQTALVDIPYLDSHTRSVLILHDMPNLGDILKKSRDEFYGLVRVRFATEVEEFLMARGFKWGMSVEEFERINKTTPDGTNHEDTRD